MIRFEINEFPFALTNDQFFTINQLIQPAPELDYDIVEGDTQGIVWLWAHHEAEEECENPTRYWISVAGTVSLAEEVTWDWRGTGTRTPRVEMSVLYPHRHAETIAAWTDRILTHSRGHEVNRQCSIGWHDECSNPSGTECQCLCHGAGVDWYSVEGHAENGLTTITRVEKGKHHWPAQPGEPATIWAHWVLAISERHATEQATTKQENLT